LSYSRWKIKECSKQNPAKNCPEYFKVFSNIFSSLINDGLSLFQKINYRFVFTLKHQPKSSYGKSSIALSAKFFNKAANNSYYVSACISTCRFVSLQYRESKEFNSCAITKQQ